MCKKLTSGLFGGIIRPANKVSKILNLRLDEKIGGSPINSKIMKNRRRKRFLFLRNLRILEVVHMVTYEALFTYTLVIIGIVELVLKLTQNKKK